MDENLISINKLSFGYGKELLHKDINMQFNRGKVSAIMGGSGCGKTTILRLIGGQLKPNSGNVNVDGKVVHEQGREGLRILEGKWACYSSMEPYLPIYLFMKMWPFQCVNTLTYLKM